MFAKMMQYEKSGLFEALEKLNGNDRMRLQKESEEIVALVNGAVGNTIQEALAKLQTQEYSPHLESVLGNLH